MDGVFVPDMSAGAGFVKALDVDLLRDVHLMIENPSQHVASYVKAGADIITIHAEANGAAKALENVKESSKEAGRQVLSGIGIMPETSLSEIENLLDMKPDMILVLSLDPRKKTAPNIKDACNRIKELRERYGHNGPLLAFDGGVTIDNIKEITQCQPDIIVSGSAILGADNPRSAFEIMSTAC
jgi:ribulose-phosphate 3-epimerase